MALKQKITKEEFAKLAAHFQGEYVEDGDGYRLDVEGAEDTGALQRAKVRETELRKEAEKNLKVLQDAEAERQRQIETLTEDQARKAGDIATLEKGWQAKLDQQKSDYEGKLGKVGKFVDTTLRDNVAIKLAGELSPKHSALLLPHIKARIGVDSSGDEPKTVILGADGKPSELTLDGLKAELVANKDYAGIIIASQASGGATTKTPQTPNGSASGLGKQNTDLSKLSATDLAVSLGANLNKE